jgi:hypothetical protein
MPDIELWRVYRDVKAFKITISNPTSYNTAQPHVQHIAIKDSHLQYWLNTVVDVRRIAFLDPQAGALAPSWYSVFDGVYHHWFVKTNQISAQSTYTLYLLYSYDSILADGKTVGISAWAGQQMYAIPYGQLDNGDSIFLLYDNFAGTSLSSAWTQYLNGNTVTVNNGLTMTSPSGASGSLGLVRSLTATSIGAAVHMVFDVLQCCGCSSGGDLGVEVGNSLTVPWSGNSYMTSDFGYNNNTHFIDKVSNGLMTNLVSTILACGNYRNIYYMFEWLYTTQSYLYFYNSLGISLSASDTTYTPSAISQLMLGIYKPNGGTASYLVHHLAVYDPPPVQPDLPTTIAFSY